MALKKKYSNPYIGNIRRTARDFLRWQLGHYNDILPPSKPPKDFTYPKPEIPLEKSAPKVKWINHCTFLVEIDGLRFLTDPIWSKRCSPFQFIGPKRHHSPPLEIKDLDPIDFVLISHNHYDHLDERSVLEIHRKFPFIKWFVPKGVGKWFLKRGISNIKELSWWEEALFSPYVTIASVPAQHNSGRGIFDTNKSLWMGLVVRVLREDGSFRTVYFVGDTAYNAYDFKKIGERFPSIDLCLCPIGTYKPGRFMRTVHSSPDDAVNIHIDVKAKLSIGMHWKTFRLSTEPMNRPPYDLYLAMKRKGINPHTFLPLSPGESINW